MEFGRILSGRAVGDSDEILDLMEKILRAETAIAKSGENQTWPSPDAF